MDEENSAYVDQSAKAAGDIVLIAIDGSKQSEGAFDWYFKNLHRTENKIIIVHGLEIPMMPTRDSWDQQVQSGNKKKEELQEKYRQKFKGYGVTDGRFVAGFEKPGELIVDTARKEKVTYVVMGTRGQSKLRRTVLGSVSDFVIHHIHCPIIVSRT